MNSKKPIEVNINFDWRVLLIAMAILAVLFIAYIRTGAQESEQLDVNSPQAQPVSSEPEPEPEVISPGEPPGPGMVPTTNGEWIPEEQLGSLAELTPDNVMLASSGGATNFYLTDANYATDKALTACASGYHMASLWEILDVSNLTYDYNHPAAHTKTDSGSGPPSSWYGWARTGWNSSTSATAGTGNCSTWTSTSGANSTVAVRLSRTWETAPGDIFTWDATSYACTFTGPVWCVRD